MSGTAHLCRRAGAACAVWLLGVWCAWAGGFEALLYDATRYANTPARREAKVAARAALVEQLPESMRAALDYIHGDHVGLQVLVMEWVLAMPSDKVVPALAERLDDARVETRRFAAYALGFHPSAAEAYTERVMALLDEELTRGAAVRTLGKWKVGAARPAMERLLVEGHERQRVVAANALRDLGDAAAVPALVGALGDPVFTVRNTAARALVSFGAVADAALAEAEQVPAAMAVRIRADLGVLSVDEALGDPGVMVDGDFFLP
jgi:hypothetical protein